MIEECMNMVSLTVSNDEHANFILRPLIKTFREARKRANNNNIYYWIERCDTGALAQAHKSQTVHWLISITLRYVTWLNELKYIIMKRARAKRRAGAQKEAAKKTKLIKNLVHFWIMMVEMKYLVWHGKRHRWTTVIHRIIFTFFGHWFAWT